MKLPVTYALILFLISFKSSAQKPCDFLGPLHFKNGKATAIVKATYLGFTETNNPQIIEQLHKKKIIDGKKYANIDFKGEGGIGGTDIDFSIANCPTPFYYGTVQQGLNLNKLKSRKIIKMKCTVYQGVKNDKGLPFFTVEEIN
ncbi:hypothetical protein FO440_08705 [Mucilaginibacter corticis]|uniref:Uncharacterized protein n=1 Tax=Mucilaginibacter corticis TaxID=2597670 RepID=A0A556MWP9_9SPHI|nr:hypothetical protein [Mucilaginibacter corticis]TSJ44238.1 hypothetical protein FO440_08705 [Mucilaginibacter corticis]